MKAKQEKIDVGIKRLEKLKQETILRYIEIIDYDQELSLYDVMINRFVQGDFDDFFDTDVTKGMGSEEKKELFLLAREFVGLCFSNGDVDYWLDSLENMPITDPDLITYSIFDNFDYLLELAKDGGRNVLELLVSLRACSDLRDTALVSYLRNTFIDDRVLSGVLFEMADSSSFYKIFTDEQKGILCNYPEGTLYAYDDDEIKITSPLILGVQIYNSVNEDNVIDKIDEANLTSVLNTLKKFYREDEFDFEDETLTLVDRYRDYVRKNDIKLGNEFSSIFFDTESDMIQDAWISGDENLGSMLDTPYSGGSK